MTIQTVISWMCDSWQICEPFDGGCFPNHFLGPVKVTEMRGERIHLQETEYVYVKSLFN